MTFSFEESFIKGFNSIFGLLFNIDELLESEESLEISVTIEFNDKWEPETLCGTKVFDFQLIFRLACFKNSIPRMTDSILIGTMRNTSWYFILVMSNFNIV